MPSFTDFSLQPATLSLLASMDILEPTPVQAEAIPALLAGHDLVGQSATGSGKTLAYGIPLVERLARDQRVVQALVLVPTRELAVQVNAVLSKLATNRRLTTALLVGGKPYTRQNAALRYGSQIVVGTPGRVKDHIEQGTLVLSQMRICVLDEADQMLDIGFAPVIEDILTHTPETRQMALFSATMPDWVEKLEQKFLKDPVKVHITPAQGGQSTIEQIAYQIPHDQKMAALCSLLQSAAGESTLIFGRTKYGVEKLGQQLSKLGFTVGTLHGNKSQRAREDVLAAFRRGQVQTLLATNVAARGLDIAGIYQVINYELPESSELFTHRIGRTGRMGRQGKAITLLVPGDVSRWRRMARSLGQAVTLQRLTLDDVSNATPPSVRVETPRAEEHESESEQRPAHVRSSFAGSPGRGQNEVRKDTRPRPSFSTDQEYEPYRELWPARTPRPVEPARQDERRFVDRSARASRTFANAYEEYDERPARDHKKSSADRERSFAPEHDGRGLDRTRGRAQAGAPGRKPARSSSWQTEGFPLAERRSARPSRDDGRAMGTGKATRARKTGGKHQAHPFVTTEAQARNRAIAVPVGRPRKNVAARRAVGR